MKKLNREGAMKRISGKIEMRESATWGGPKKVGGRIRGEIVHKFFQRF